MSQLDNLVTPALPDERISLIMRAFFELTPPVTDTTNAIPLLAVIYFTSQMSFLSECVPDSSKNATGSIDAALLRMFSFPVSGSQLTCTAFGGDDRAPYLTGRIKAKNQFLGQPSVVPPTLPTRLNPLDKPQWVSQRMRLREEVPLDNKRGTEATRLTSTELRRLQSWLSTQNGRAAATSARCTLSAGTDAAGLVAPALSLKVDYGFPWRAE